ncbi:MAG TPA: Eco57I restriction-modification methylase domain-containing protein [Terriglobia bacterium]|nr:Eco57I restriction-modification methylase domain-containing protein [Terriglobia bacterium]
MNRPTEHLIVQPVSRDTQVPAQLLHRADALRLQVAPQLAPKRKAALGQFMTPLPVARFMASLFPPAILQTCRLLDAGAGVGALSCAFLDRWALADGLAFNGVELEAYEIDDTLREHLESTLASYTQRLPVTFKVLSGDFIWETARQNLQGLRPFSHVILNPPYKKINSASQHRLMLRRVGIETVNLYSAFVALSLTLMQSGGQLVAIIPRSFCNGPYYRPFREFLLRHAALRHVHLFGARNQAFKDDDVLQENVIIRLERGGRQDNVTVSTSTNDSFTDLRSHEHPFDRIVFPDDPQRFIHVPTSPGHNEIELSAGIRSSLTDIGIAVSTGPVVDFRLLEHIRQTPTRGTVPLLYPGHFVGRLTQWPKEGMKRGNAITLNAATKKWLYPAGFYTVARRFSAKEERRRLVASIVSPASFPEAAMLGFENHLNVFHQDKRGLPENLAHGLAAFLNTTAVDDHFRRFNGHTQVNATDLRLMKYPSRSVLIAFGQWARAHDEVTQAMLDDKLRKLTQ